MVELLSRFFIDHGVVHDRLTGQHVGMEAEPDHAERLLALLRELEMSILKAEIRGDPDDEPSAGGDVNTVLHAPKEG